MNSCASRLSISQDDWLAWSELAWISATAGPAFISAQALKDAPKVSLNWTLTDSFLVSSRVAFDGSGIVPSGKSPLAGSQGFSRT